MSSLVEVHNRALARLVWKEFRQYRAVIFTLLAAGLLLQLVALSWSDGSMSLLLCAGVFPIMCGLAIAATTFSGEHESNSFLCLRGLPATQRQVVWSKIAISVGAALLLFLCLWFVVWLSKDRLVGPSQVVMTASELGQWFVGSVSTLVEVIVFGVWFSLRDRRPLVALIKAIASVAALRAIAAFVSLVLVQWSLLRNQITNPETTDLAIIVSSGTVRGLAVLAMVLLIVRTAPRWFRDESPSGVSLRPRSLFGPDAIPTSRITTPVHPGRWRRLLWLQSKYTLWIAGSIVGLSLASWIFEMRFGPINDIRALVATYCAFGGLVLLGALTFRAVNSQKSFVAALGARPTAIWLSQLLLPAAACVFLLAIHCWSLRREGFLSTGYFWTIGMPLFGFFTWGQLVSLRTRSPITAIAKAVFAAVLYALLWMGLSQLEVSAAPVRWALVALVAYPLVESWWQSAKWLSGTETAKWRWPAMRAALVLCVAISVLWAYTAEYPYYSNEQVATALNDGVVPDASQLNEIRDTARRIREQFTQTLRRNAEDSYYNNVTRPETAAKIQRDWVESSRAELERVLELPFQEVAAKYWIANRNGPTLESIFVLGEKQQIEKLLAHALKIANEDGDVDLAERVIRKVPFLADPIEVARWAWLEQNTPDRVRDLIKFLNEDADPRAATLRNLSHVYQDSIPNYLDRAFGGNGPRNLLDTFTYAVNIPRENRWHRWVAAQLPNGIQAAEQAIALKRSVYQIKLDRLGRDGYISPSADRMSFANNQALSGLAYNIWLIRGMAIQLSAICWAREHDGQPPDSMDQFVPSFFDAIPIDPFTGHPFIYVRDLRVPVRPRDRGWRFDTPVDVTTFVFSPGSNGYNHINHLINQFRRKYPNAHRMPEIIWRFEDVWYSFRFANASYYPRFQGGQSLKHGHGEFFPIVFAEGDEEKSVPPSN